MKKHRGLKLLRFAALTALTLLLLFLARQLLPRSRLVLTLLWGTDGLIAWLIVLSLGSWIACRLLQHIGFLLFSLLCGYRLAEWSLLGLGLHRSVQGKLRLMYRRPAGGYVTLRLTPPHMDGTSPWLLPMCGGTILIAAGVIACSLTAFFLRSQKEAPLLLMPCVVGILMIAARCIPDGSGYDHFAQMQQLKSNALVRQAREQLMHLYAFNRRGMLIADMPESCFTAYPEEALDNRMIYVVSVPHATRLLSHGQYEEAYALLEKLLRHPHPREPIGRYLTICNAAFCEALLGLPAVHANELEDPNLQLFLSSVPEVLLRAQYAVARLVRRDPAASDRLLADFEACLHKKPARTIEIARQGLQAIEDAYNRQNPAGGIPHEQ